MRGRKLALLLLALTVWSGCARKRARAPQPPRIGAVETGIASWYGHPYHGRRAANGEIYDMEELTAAHRTLPFDTWVRVENVGNRKSVVVRITDRGPFVNGRVIDLSRRAAREIEMIGPGTAKVRVIITAPPPKPPAADLFAVQIGAFQDRARAEDLRRRIESRHQTVRVVRRDGSPPMWRVLVGRESSLVEAEDLAGRLRLDTGAAFVVRLDEVEP